MSGSGGSPQHPPDDVNPFEQHVINMMLNTLGVPIGRMEKISGNFPRIVSGCSLEVGRDRYDSVKSLSEGGFAKIYIGDRQGQLDVLKVLNIIHTHTSSKMRYMCCGKLILLQVDVSGVIGSESSHGVGVGSCGRTTYSS